MADIYIVKKGDTLSKIATDNKTTVKYLATLNNIENPNYIIVGQRIKLSGTPDPVQKNLTSKATITNFGVQSNTERTIYATWAWDRSNTKEYKVSWYYTTGDGVRFVGSESTVTAKQAVYTAPENARRVVFRVKPISKTRTVNKKETVYWTGSWSTDKIYSFSDSPPSVPPVPTVTIEDYKLTARLDNLDLNATSIEFQIYKNDSSKFNTGVAKIKTDSASYSCNVDAGNRYKVRCRAIRGSLYSEDWSDYSSNVYTKPAAPKKLSKCVAMTETSVYLEWASVKNATKYDIQYATEKRYFDGSDQVKSVNDITTTQYEMTLETTGKEYFFRIRAGNDTGYSDWSSISSVVIGTTPSSPSTWSSANQTSVGGPLTLYWVHNAEDESKQTSAEVELTVTINRNGDIETTVENYTVKGTGKDDGTDTDKDEDEADIGSYTIQTSNYDDGASIAWRVRTAGATGTYGPWSVQRTIDIYAEPTLDIDITDVEGTSIDVLEIFPFYVKASTGPETQWPIGYHVSITANEAYETTDNVGNVKMVNRGESVYSKYFETTDQLLVELSASNMSLENNMSYTVACVASMNSGLTAQASDEFTVSWIDMSYEPTAEIGINEDTYSAYIRPYCEDENGELIEDVILSVYRREYDGSFVELGVNLDNVENTFITDPHPALDYARYRIVAKSKTTGTVCYCDLPGYPVDCNAVIIQWDEDWSTFDTSSEDALEVPPWSGSLLKLPYNIDVSDRNKVDAKLVKYIGRKYPVGYYGTQNDTTSTWKLEIEKDDKETLYGIRRLQVWHNNVYVREPSGSGYWANIEVSFDQTHCEVTIPVTISVTRVEGGA